jgi:hypothetical protein
MRLLARGRRRCARCRLRMGLWRRGRWRRWAHRLSHRRRWRWCRMRRLSRCWRWRRGGMCGRCGHRRRGSRRVRRWRRGGLRRRGMGRRRRRCCRMRRRRRGRLLMRRRAGWRCTSTRPLRLARRRLTVRGLLRPSIRADFALRLRHHERSGLRLRSGACHLHRRQSGRRKQHKAKFSHVISFPM